MYDEHDKRLEEIKNKGTNDMDQEEAEERLVGMMKRLKLTNNEDMKVPL
jgi:hypothetical protein